jgi:NAD(P)-dependent dehydrogenase (short-subunit alcohol dehydrogenase family)
MKPSANMTGASSMSDLSRERVLGQRLQNRRTIVTGAGSGIGRAVARRFAAEGAAVLAVDMTKTAVEATVGEITRTGGTAIAVAADAGREADVAAFVTQAVEAFGGLDVIHANAGISGGLVALLEQTVELWQEILRINLIGPFLAIKHAAPHLLKQGKGSIICTASVAGLRANAGGNPYSASKAGVISLVQTAANSFYDTGVRVNAICPGLIETGMTQSIFARARERGTDSKIGQLNPLRRHGLPEEIAAVALFLASDEASYVNGQAIPVDGGLSSTLPFTAPRAWR